MGWSWKIQGCNDYTVLKEFTFTEVQLSPQYRHKQVDLYIFVVVIAKRCFHITLTVVKEYAPPLGEQDKYLSSTGYCLN